MIFTYLFLVNNKKQRFFNMFDWFVKKMQENIVFLDFSQKENPAYEEQGPAKLPLHKKLNRNHAAKPRSHKTTW